MENVPNQGFTVHKQSIAFNSLWMFSQEMLVTSYPSILISAKQAMQKMQKKNWNTTALPRSIYCGSSL